MWQLNAFIHSGLKAAESTSAIFRPLLVATYTWRRSSRRACLTERQRFPRNNWTPARTRSTICSVISGHSGRRTIRSENPALWVQGVGA